jgi:hypothetical protein
MIVPIGRATLQTEAMTTVQLLSWLAAASHEALQYRGQPRSEEAQRELYRYEQEAARRKWHPVQLPVLHVRGVKLI